MNNNIRFVYCVISKFISKITSRRIRKWRRITKGASQNIRFWQGVIGSGSLNQISGSSISTGSFGTPEATNIKVGGGVFTSASLASGGSGGGDGIF